MTVPDRKRKDREAEASDNAAVATLDTVPAPPQDDVAAEPTPIRKPRRSVIKGPANLGASVLELPVTLRLISLGKPAMNVSATLGFDLDHPSDHDLKDFMGEQAFAARFAGSYLGNGLVIREAPLKASSADNKVTQKLKVVLPRFDQGADQIERYVVPILGIDLEALFGIDPTWRLNINVNEPGALILYEMQGSFDLVTKAAEDLTGETGGADL